MSELDSRNLEIVEELRADIDFEIDDVIAQIVRGLPEDYYLTLSRAEQLKHLKALLALGVCNIKEEIRMGSEDGRFIAVVARQDYPGLLAKILGQLPSEPPLVGAKAFTSRGHDFIIDLFEFESDAALPPDSSESEFMIAENIRELANVTQRSESDIRDFVKQYPLNSPVVRSSHQLADQFHAYERFISSGKTTVRMSNQQAETVCLTIASDCASALELFRTTANFLAKKDIDIQQAMLNEVAGNKMRVAIAGIHFASPPEYPTDELERELELQFNN